MENGQRKIKTYTFDRPIVKGFRIRVDTSFDNDRDIDKAWEWIGDALEAHKADGEWSWSVRPETLLHTVRSYFECNKLYDIMREGNEAVFLKLEGLSNYAIQTSRPEVGVRELIPRTFWSIELVNKDLLKEVVYTSPIKL